MLKAQLTGAVLGGGITLLVYGMVRIFQHGESMIAFLLIIPSHLVFFPAAHFAQWRGWTWKLPSFYEATAGMVFFTAAFNAIVLAAAGTILGVVKLMSSGSKRQS